MIPRGPNLAPPTEDAYGYGFADGYQTGWEDGYAEGFLEGQTADE